MNKATNVKKQILASQIAYKRTQNNEVQLEKALAKFFNKLKKEVLNALDEYWKDYQMLQGHIDLITAPVHEAHKEYYELLTLYIKREYRLGSAEAKRLVKLANSKQRVASKSMRMPVRAIIKKDNDLFGTLPSAEERLLNRTFTASERTLSRVDSQINQIITDGYRSGKGINDVANSLNQRFDQLTSWESKRIARTEIHNSHNVAVMDTYKELDVEYTMWIAAEDERTRDSHLEINGEIIPIGSEYSNGLKYPGDTSGDIEEWINCRCSNAPFVVPYGFMAPSFSPFRESDLIKVETKPPANEPTPVETENTDLNGTRLLSKEEVNQMDFQQLAEHHGAEYKGIKVYEYDGKKYHIFEQTFDNNETLTLHFEEGAVKSYSKKGLVTPNEIVDEVFKVPNSLKRQTDEIWFKNTNTGIHHNIFNKSGYDTLGQTVGGYNTYNPLYRQRDVLNPSPEHKIVINPKYFKGAKGRNSFIWEPTSENARDWKMTIHHEFTHSIDKSREAFLNASQGTSPDLAYSSRYTEVHNSERYFTWYANTERGESFAEHGGYVSRMLANPEEQAKTIKIKLIEEGQPVEKHINFKEYQKLYPKHYDYFTKLLKGDIPCY